MQELTEGDVASELDRIRTRLDREEQRVERLENTLKAVARETTDLTISVPCSKCERCLLVRIQGEMYCPKCGNGRTL